MFGKRKHITASAPEPNKEHEKTRKEVIKSREMLLKEIARLEKKFDLKSTRRKP